MSWDFAFQNGDMTGGYVTGDDEVIQRVITRLERESGEWFLNEEAGLPWYQGGRGILGSSLKNKSVINQIIREKVQATEGVSRVSRMNTVFDSGTRQYAIYMQIVLSSGETVSGTLFAGQTTSGVSIKWLQNSTA